MGMVPHCKEAVCLSAKLVCLGVRLTIKIPFTLKRKQTKLHLFHVYVNEIIDVSVHVSFKFWATHISDSAVLYITRFFSQMYPNYEKALLTKQKKQAPLTIEAVTNNTTVPHNVGMLSRFIFSLD